MKTQRLILLSSLCALTFSSCSSTNTDGTTASSGGGWKKGLIGAGLGGVIGALVGDNLLNRNDNNNNRNGSSSGGGGGSSGNGNGNNNNDNGFLDDNAGLITGVVAGGAVGMIGDSMAQREVRQKYLDGYNKGRSDAIKDLYWLKRDAERPGGAADLQRRYYEVPVPEHVTTDGVLVEPRKVVIEVVE
jgi:gas vesicle protein